MGMIEAAKEVFPEVTIRGCLFHFSQCLFRHVQSIGLINMFKDSLSFRLMFNRIKALPLLDINLIDQVMGIIMSSYQYESSLVQQFLTYVENTWTGPDSKFPRNMVCNYIYF